jgi:hypothetical protein
MSLFKPIADSDYTKVAKCINKGADPNDVMNSTPPQSMLDIAIQISKDNPSNQQAQAIVMLLELKCALTYNKLVKLETKPKNRTGLPPLSVKGKTTINKTKGIAALSRRGGSRRKSRKNRC